MEPPMLFTPPDTIALPLFKRMAVWLKRPEVRLPVGIQVPTTGSNSSALVL